MKSKEFFKGIENIVHEILTDEEKYIDFCKTIGNNHRYQFVNQLSIYKQKPLATACATYEQWKSIYSRQVTKGQKGIPVLTNTEEMDYVFDVTQTISRNNIDLERWEYTEEDRVIIQNELNQIPITENESIKEWVEQLSKDIVNNELTIDSELKEYKSLFEVSLSIAISQRLNVPFPFEDSKELIKENLSKIDMKTFIQLGENVSKLNKNTIDGIMKKSQALKKKKELTNNNDVVYNNVDNIYGEGEKNHENSNVVRSIGILSSDRQRENHSELRDNRRDSMAATGVDGGQVGGTDRVHEGVSLSNIRTDATRVSSIERESGNVDEIQRDVLFRHPSKSSDGRSETSSEDDSEEDRTYDESLGDYQRNETQRSSDVQWDDDQSTLNTEGDNHQGTSRSINSKLINNERANEALFFYSKENPKDLMPKEILENVSKLYDQENIEPSDKIVHAAYMIPLKSNKTWYLTEYDEKTRDAFGLVLGNEAEWGYFNLEELQDLGAERLILEDFPKTFRDIKDTELKQQMTEEELQLVFNGQLSFVTSNQEINNKESHNILDAESEKHELNGIEDHEKYISLDASKYYIDLPIYKKDHRGNYEREGVIIENNYNPDGMSSLKMVNHNGSTDILYSDIRPIDSLYARLSDLTFYSNKEKELKDLENQKNSSNDYWIVEFNERSEDSYLNKNYEGMPVKEEMLNELKSIDQKIRTHNTTVGEDEYGTATDEWLGYYKFYFDHYVNGERIEHLRVDIGDGNEVNNRYFDYLYEQVSSKENNRQELENDKQEEITELKLETNVFDKLKKGTTVFYNRDEYTVHIEPRFNELFNKMEVWLSPSREGALNQIPIVNFRDDNESLKQISFERPMFLLGDEVTYQGNNYTISRFDETGGFKTVTLDSHTTYMNGFISGSEVVIFNSDRHLETMIQNKTYTSETSKDSVETNENESKKPLKNFVIENETIDLKATPSQRMTKNMEAITVLNEVESGELTLDADGQKTLANYVGWGGLSDVFDERKGGQYGVTREYLKKNLSSKEYEEAKASTLTSFYTPKIVIDGMYKAIETMGFKSGNILEPSMGVGHFIGNLPSSLSHANVYGVELDQVSGRIGSMLYPESTISIKGFEETSFSNNFFDLAIGNIPFGDYRILDREYDKHKFLIHDYFIAKSLDKVRSGGIVAFVTSSGTLDKKDETFRKHLASRAELLGAIRLPNSTFKSMAGTEVTSDILFLQKRENVLERDEPWIRVQTDFNKGLTYNNYFHENPNMVIGNIEKISGPFGDVLSCQGDLYELQEQFNQALQTIAQQTQYSEVVRDNGEIEIIDAPDGVKNFSFNEYNGIIYQREDSKLVPLDVTDKNKQKVKDYIRLTQAVLRVIETQKEDGSDEEIIESQHHLNKIYDEFSKVHGYINSKSNKRLFREESYYPLVSSIEVLDDKDQFIRKADIFTKRTLVKTNTIESVDNASDALILSISERGQVDLSYMEKLSSISKKELIEDLDGEIYLDLKPFNYEQETKYPFTQILEEEVSHANYVTKDDYLTGNIKEKMDILDGYIDVYSLLQNKLSEENKELQHLKIGLEKLKAQRNALEKVLPEPLKASEINVRLGATWIPKEDIEEFIRETLDYRLDVEYSDLSGQWFIQNKSSGKYFTLTNTTYGTKRANAFQLLENALNLKETRIYDRVENADGSTSSILNEKETILASEKQENLKEQFKQWIFSEPSRRHRLEKIYNERFNSFKNREYDGSNLKFEGMNVDIKLKDHQLNAIARSLYGGNTLLAHAVGSGKTFDMVAIAMESKRLGLCSKSLFVVPNHLTTQIGREFMLLYPGANILVADKKDFTPDRRKRFISRIATGEYDAVIIGHSQFERIPMSKEYQEKHIKEQIDEIINYVTEYKYDRGQNFTVKQLEKSKKKLEARLEKLNDDFKKDDVITFEELGVDKLFIDEAHNYKNLYLYTKMKNVAGIGQSEAQKSSDMFMKCRYMDEITNGKGIVFATGTPISNSMTELYTMQRYLQYDTLKSMKLENFDAWASNFGDTVSAIELSPEGTGYRMKTRFSKFYNLPELMSTFKEVADIQTADMLDLATPDKVNFEVIKTVPSEEQKEMLLSLAERATKVRNRSVDRSKDNMLLITNDGKKLALDQRLINPLLPDDPDSKVNSCIRNVFNIWDETKDKRSTQLIFCDMSIPKKDGTFSVYDDVKNKLIEKGVPSNEIAFIHDATTDKQRDELFAKVRKGDVRILMGSTEKMGAGTNVQDLLVASHDLDVPWRPSDLEQRAGRIIRQGNSNNEVSVFRYVTENTFDSYLWQMIENKQRFISQIMTSKSPVRVAEDIDEATLSYAEIKALATGNPLIKEKMELENEVSKLKMLESNFKSKYFEMEDNVQYRYPNKINRLEERIKNIEADIKHVEPLKESEENRFTSITIDGKTIYDKKEAGQSLLDAIKGASGSTSKQIGRYRNLELSVSFSSTFKHHEFTLKGKEVYHGNFGTSAEGNITRLDNVIGKMEVILEKTKMNLEETKTNLRVEQEELSKPFLREDELKNKQKRLNEVNKTLHLEQESNQPEINLHLEELKKTIIDFRNREYNEENQYDDFDILYPDLSSIDLAYTTTHDGKNEIQYSMNLVSKSATLSIDGKKIETINFLEDFDDPSLNGLNRENQALIMMKEQIIFSEFNDLVYVDEETLFNATGLKLDEDGNIYLPKEGEIYFKDSKPSILEKIESYQSSSDKPEAIENRQFNHER